MNYFRVLGCCLVLLVSQQVYAQIRWSSSLNAGAVIPIGDLADVYSTGYEFGLKLLPTNDRNVKLAGGLLYSFYPGNEAESYGNSSILKLYLGTQIESRLFYILPAIAGNFSGGSFRLGFDGILGFTWSLNEKWYLDLSGKYEIQNLVGMEDGESTVSAMHIGLGIGTNF